MRPILILTKDQMKDLLVNSVFIALVAVIALTSVTIYVGYKVMNPMKLAVMKLPSEYHLQYEDVSFENIYDGVELKGWWIPSTNYDFISQKAVIFSHSYGDNREAMPIETLKLAKRLSTEGFHVFMYDFRNSGESGESATTIGRMEKTDLLSAIDYVKDKKGIQDIALIGWSMGASTSIMVGSESDAVKVVVADSPFADLEQYTIERFSYWTGLPSPFGKYMIKMAQNIFVELNLTEVKPYIAAKSYETKGLLLIHSKNDGAISYKESELIYSNAPNAEIWITQKGGHIRNYKHQKELYEERIIEFINKHIEDSYIFDRI